MTRLFRSLCRCVVSVYHITLYFIESIREYREQCRNLESSKKSSLTTLMTEGDGGEKSRFCNTQIPRQQRGCRGGGRGFCITRTVMEGKAAERQGSGGSEKR